MKTNVFERNEMTPAQRKAIAEEVEYRRQESEYNARFTPEYFAGSGRRIMEIAAEMDRALTEARDMPLGPERKSLLRFRWRTFRDYVNELAYGIRLLPNIENTGFRHWRITDVALAVDFAIQHEDDEKLCVAIAQARQIGQAITTAMQGVSLDRLPDGKGE